MVFSRERKKIELSDGHPVSGQTRKYTIHKFRICIMNPASAFCHRVYFFAIRKKTSYYVEIENQNYIRGKKVSRENYVSHTKFCDALRSLRPQVKMSLSSNFVESRNPPEKFPKKNYVALQI